MYTDWLAPWVKSLAISGGLGVACLFFFGLGLKYHGGLGVLLGEKNSAEDEN